MTWNRQERLASHAVQTLGVSCGEPGESDESHMRVKATATEELHTHSGTLRDREGQPMGETERSPRSSRGALVSGTEARNPAAAGTSAPQVPVLDPTPQCECVREQGSASGNAGHGTSTPSPLLPLVDTARWHTPGLPEP